MRTYGPMNAGDATFHSGWVLHSAPGIPSKTLCREVMTVIYMAEDTRVTVSDHENHENVLASWLPDCRPGDLAASPLNPGLYSSRQPAPRKRAGVLERKPSLVQIRIG